MEKTIIIEGYSINAINYFLVILDSPKVVPENNRLDAYQRLCKVTLTVPKEKPDEADFNLLVIKINNLLTSIRIQGMKK